MLNWRNPEKNFTSHQVIKKSNIKLTPYLIKKKNKNHWLKRFFRFLMPFIILGIFLTGLVIIGMLAWISKDLPSPDGVLKRQVTLSTKIYDRTGKTVLYDIYGDIKRTAISLDQVPEYAKQAVITAEDRNFYKHKGFSITGIIRSIIINTLTGSRVGGSTLTQQFVKNAILTNEKTYTRKIKELLISYRIEKTFSKDEILNMYLNEIPYGSVIYGIEAASQSFFGKPAKDLSLAEAAILAAIPNRPTYYSPYGSHKDQLLIRQRYILDSMAELGYITKEQAEAAKNEKIIFKPLKESIIAPHFVMYVKELLSEKYGENFINQEGLKVYTTLDLEKQKIAEEAIKKGMEDNSKKYGFNNASLVSLDPKTGQILAMVGSADFFNEEIDGQVNVSIRPRQPGSSFKPIVYLASFIKGYTPDTIVYDTLTNFDTGSGTPYQPKNYNLKENGPVTLRKALAGSLNIPAVKVTYLTGMDNVLNLADELGYTTLKDRDRFGLSIVLGGAEVKLLEHAQAYAIFAQEGVKHEISAILKIEDKNGRIIEEYKDKSKAIIEPEFVRNLTDILSDDTARSYIFGPGSKLTLPDRPVAAKTGTTNDYRDAWTMGYTPSLVCGVWVGNTDNKEMKRGADGSVVAAPIWNQYMREALKNTPVESFTKPEKIVTGKPILDGQIEGSKTIKIDTISGKLATEYTPESTIKEIPITEIHDILHYVNKDDPRGPEPENPAEDPQYYNWELGVKNWAEKNGINLKNDYDIPTEYDDVHLPQDKPTVSIITPTDQQTIKENYLNIKISAHANRGIKKIEYLIDGEMIEVDQSGSLEKELEISQLSSGYHTLKINVKDDLENTGSASMEFNLLINTPKPVFDWQYPTNNSQITNFPIKIKASLLNWELVKQVDLYGIEKNGNEFFIDSINPSSELLIFNWKEKPSPANYQLFANIFDFKNKKYNSTKLKVTVQ